MYGAPCTDEERKKGAAQVLPRTGLRQCLACGQQYSPSPMPYHLHVRSASECPEMSGTALADAKSAPKKTSAEQAIV